MNGAVVSMVASVTSMIATTTATTQSNGSFRDLFLSFVDSGWSLLFFLLLVSWALYSLIKILIGGGKDE